MNRPHFVNLALTCLFVDLFFLLTIPILGYLSIAVILLVVPILLASGSGDALRWLRAQQPNNCPWSALAKAMCGVSLIFLALVASVTLMGEGGGDIWWLILHLYLLLVAFRLYGAAVLTCLLSPLSFFLGRGAIAKTSSLSALLNAALGLYLLTHISKIEGANEMLVRWSGLAVLQQANGGGSYLMTLGVFTISFLGGIAWGASLQWVAWRLNLASAQP